MSNTTRLDRRTFLKGLGTAMALPMFESMLPTSRVLGASASLSDSVPLRTAFIFVPNGAHMPDWTPKQTGANYQMPFIMEPLESMRRKITIMSGLTHDKGRANDDGAGDHARSAGVFLTGVQPLKEEGAIRGGTSIDQHIASRIGHLTRFPSLELGTEGGRQAGSCDSGYSCAYSNNIAWKNPTTPLPKETNPRAVFERLFASQMPKQVDERQARMERYRKSILDYVLEDSKKLNQTLGRRDQQKLDEYLTSVREIEGRLQRMEEQENGNSHIILAKGYEEAVASGIPDTYADHIRIMCDMMVLAFQTDTTRVATCMFANAGSNKSYGFIGVADGHHSLSHHQGDPVKHDKIRRINRFHVEQLSYFLQKLDSIVEPNGRTLLDNSAILYGSGISDGNRHNNENLPLLMAGSAGNAFRTGVHIAYDEEIPVSNYFISLLDRLGIPERRFSDSTGPLPKILA